MRVLHVVDISHLLTLTHFTDMVGSSNVFDVNT